MAENLTKEEAGELEKKSIQLYKSYDGDFGYNLSLGGECSAYGMHHTEEAKRLMGESRSGENSYWYGKTLPPETVAKMIATKRKNGTIKYGTDNVAARPIYCIELDKYYDYASLAADELDLDLSYLIKCCMGKANTVKGYHFLYSEDVNEETIKERLKKMAPTTKKVICLNDSLVFNSVRDASEYYNIAMGAIYQSCKRKIRKWQNCLMFEYVNDNNEGDQNNGN